MINRDELNFNKRRRQLLSTYPSIEGSQIIHQMKHLPSKPGVYFIYRISDGRVYIGESYNLQKRLVEHFTTKSPNQTIDWGIYKEGAHRFRCGVIKITKNKQEALRLETKYVKLFNSYYNGYNSTNNGKRHSRFRHEAQKMKRGVIKNLFPKRFKYMKYQGQWRMLLLYWHRKFIIF